MVRSRDLSLEDAPRSCRPTVLQNDELRTLGETDSSQMARGITKELVFNHHAVLDELKRIEKVKMLEKWVPHYLNDRKKLSRFEICFSLLLRNRNHPFLKRIITYDESLSCTITGEVRDNG